MSAAGWVRVEGEPYAAVLWVRKGRFTLAEIEVEPYGKRELLPTLETVAFSYEDRTADGALVELDLPCEALAEALRARGYTVTKGPP